MTKWLTHLLVFMTIVGAVSGCASAASDRPNPSEPQEQKGKPSEPFRY